MAASSVEHRNRIRRRRCTAEGPVPGAAPGDAGKLHGRPVGKPRDQPQAAAHELTPTEYELLRLLLLEAGRVVTHRALLDQIWSRRAKSGWKVVRAFVK